MTYPVERPAMELTPVDGIDLELYDRGSGEPVVFVHGGSTDECSAVLQEPALDHPDAVHTLALAEPSLPVETAEPEVGPAVEAAVQRYMTGDKEGAVRTAFSAICGPGFDATFDRILPAGWLERWAADADTLIQHDIPALGSWGFTPEDAATIEAPVLNLVGADSAFAAVQPILQSWIPHAEPVTMPDTAHCIFEVAPRAAAEHLASFFSRHPLER